MIEALDDLFEGPGPVGRTLSFLRAGVELHRDDAIGAEARIDAHHADEAADEEPGTDEEDHRESHLADDERGAQTLTTAASAGAARAVTQRFREVRP